MAKNNTMINNYITNEEIKYINSLKEKNNRHKGGYFWCEGSRNIESLIQNKATIKYLLISDNYNKPVTYNLPIKKIKENQVKKIKSTQSFPGIGALIKIKKEFLEFGSSVIALDGINDPGNLGTIIRTALWFNIKDIILSPDCTDPFNDKAVRSAMGATTAMNFLFSRDFMKDIVKYQKKKYQIITTSLEGSNMPINFPPKKIFVFGNEAHGISPDILKLSDTKIKIPKYGNQESLNVAIACGIILYAQSSMNIT